MSFCNLIGETKIPKYADFWVNLMYLLESRDEEEILTSFSECNPNNYTDFILMIANYFNNRVNNRDFYGNLALKILNQKKFFLKYSQVYIRHPTFTFFLYKNRYFPIECLPEVGSNSLYFSFLADSLIDRENPFIPPDYMFVNNAPNKKELITQIAMNGYLDNSPELAIKNDDVQMFNNIIASNGLDINSKTTITPYDVCSFDLIYRKSKPISFLSFAAFYGAKKIFKELLLEGLTIDSEVFGYAVRGGDFELIHICEHNLTNIDQEITTAALNAVLYCRNDVADWAIQKGALFADLDSAVIANNIPAVLFCLAKGITSNEALHQSMIIGNPGVVEAMLERHSPDTEAPRANRAMIHEAANFGNLNAIRLLIEKGGDVNKLACCSNAGMNALHFAALEGFENCISYLIEKGCDFRQRNYAGCTPLHIAANNGHAEAALLLINAGLGPNELNQIGMSPLYLATQFAPKNSKLKIIKLLIENGADPQAGNPKYSPIDAAKRSNLDPEIIKLLQ